MKKMATLKKTSIVINEFGFLNKITGITHKEVHVVVQVFVDIQNMILIIFFTFLSYEV